MKKFMIAVAAVMLAAGQNAFAYDPDALDYSFGTVKAVSPTEVTLGEYDFEGDLEKTVDVIYVINSETGMDNFEKIEDLAVGEDVEVYFVEEDGKKIAVSLAKDEGVDLDAADYGDEEMMDEDMPSDDMPSESVPMDTTATDAAPVGQ